LLRSRSKIKAPQGSSYHKLTWAYLNFLRPQAKRQGIGRAVLEFWSSRYGIAAVERHTGIPNDEGSHPTGDAPGFVELMVKEGLL
jgi:hypothetical protein